MHYTLSFISNLAARTENLHTIQKGQMILRMQLATINKLKVWYIHPFFSSKLSPFEFGERAWGAVGYDKNILYPV